MGHMGPGWLPATDFLPHGHCYLWNSGLLSLQVLANLVIALSYFSIGLTLIYLVGRLRRLPFHWMYLPYLVFIVACGITHVFDIVVIWRPVYWLDGGVRALTAVASACTAVLLFHVAGKAVVLVAAVAERERYAEELRQSDQRFHSLVDGVRDYAIFMLDPTGHVVTWSPGAVRITGYTEAQVLGRHLSLFYVPDDVTADKPGQDLRRSTIEGRFEDEGWRVRRDGSRFWANGIITALKDRQGRLCGFAQITKDVTDRRRAEELARERGVRIESLNFELAALLDTLFQTAPIGIGYVDRDLCFVRINDRLAQMHGFSVADHMGRSAAQVLRSATEIALMQEVLDTGTPVLNRELSGALSALSGPLRYWQASYYPVLVQKRAIGVGSIVEEITERKQAELEHQRLLQQAQEGVRVREVFLAVAAHELRTPLQPLRLELEGVQRSLRLGDVARMKAATSRLPIMERQLTRLERLVNDLLDVSRIAAGHLELRPERVDLAAVVREVVDRHAAELSRAGVKVTLSGEEATWGLWDRARVEQVVTNLLTNAIKYGQSRPVFIAVRAEQGQSHLSVRDEGIGIAPEHQERIFERFERAVSARHYAGLGLGLWIVRQAVGAMGGTISVQSTLGQGSTFDVRLPMDAKAGPVPAEGEC